jgi:hypothetical protein
MEIDNKDIDRKLTKITSGELFEYISKLKYGLESENRIADLVIRYANAQQVKFHRGDIGEQGLNGIIDTLGLTFQAGGFQNDRYYGDELKIRSTEDFSYNTLIYKPEVIAGRQVVVPRIAFDISGDIYKLVRREYQSTMLVQKIREYYLSSIDSLPVVRDTNIRVHQINEDQFFVSKIDNVNKDVSKQLDGEYWEVHLLSNNLLPQFRKKINVMEKQLGFVRVVGKKYPQL